MRFRSGILISSVLLTVPAALLAAGLSVQAVKKEVVEQRLASFSREATQREANLKRCSRMLVARAISWKSRSGRFKQPDLICVLPGRTNQTIVVGGALRHVLVGDGVVDN